jgi:radical SAM superfamily enzyme YgiQ (UPF0313 family)
MFYDMPLYRPPSEGENLIIQATLGCSYNHCSFCAMYKRKAFTIRPLAEVFTDIEEAAAAWPRARRVFLADGDAMTLPTAHLLAIAANLAACLPELQRITAYATPANLMRKSPEELRQLRENRLSLVYLGIESGDPEVLHRIAKGASPDGMARAIGRAREAGIKVSATVILGVAGRRLARQHAEATARLINRAPPNFLSTLQLRLYEDTAERFLQRWGGGFERQDDDGMLEEQRILLAGIDPPSPVIFRSNHASNCLPLAGTLPKDRAVLLAQLDQALSGVAQRRPTWLRGL